MLGRYKLLDQLAVGGMAVVHLAIEQGDHALNAQWSLSNCSQIWTMKALSECSYRRQLAARINHPNVVEIHEMGTHYGRPFIAMEYVPGVQMESCWWLRKMRDPVQSAGVESDAGQRVRMPPMS